MNRKLYLFVLIILMAAMSFVAATPKEDHCVIEINPIIRNEEYSKLSKPVCFGSFSEAIYFATSGTVTLEKGITPDMVTDEMLNSSGVGIQSSFIIGIDYDYSSYGGSSLVWSVSNQYGCGSGSSYAASTMPSGWSNRVSSARSYLGCSNYYHYDSTYYGGTSIDCGYSCSSMGAMDNQTESERWTP